MIASHAPPRGSRAGAAPRPPRPRAGRSRRSPRRGWRTAPRRRSRSARRRSRSSTNASGLGQRVGRAGRAWRSATAAPARAGRGRTPSTRTPARPRLRTMPSALGPDAWSTTAAGPSPAGAEGRLTRARPRRSPSSGGRWPPTCSVSRPIAQGLLAHPPREVRVVQHAAQRGGQGRRRREGGTSRPVSPSRTISGVPSTAVATTGRPQFMASQTTVGRPSLSEGSTKRSPAAIHQPTSSWPTLPTKRTRSAMPSSAARRSRAARISPMPAATSRGAPCRAPASRPIASTRVSTPLRGTSLPT